MNSAAMAAAGMNAQGSATGMPLSGVPMGGMGNGMAQTSGGAGWVDGIVYEGP